MAQHFQLRIGLDCRLSGLQHAGIGRYILNLAQRLPILAPTISWVYFVFEQAQVDELFPNKVPANVQIEICPITHYSLAEQLTMPRVFSAAKLDLLHVPHFNLPFFYTQPSVITVHDLLWHHHRGAMVTTLKGWQYWLKYLGYRMIVRKAVTTAQGIIVPTNTVKSELSAYYPQASKRVTVTLEGVDDHLKVAQPLTKNQVDQAMATKTLLFVGSLYPHKNIDVVVKALQLLPEYTLQIVGSRSIFQDRVKNLIKAEGVESQVEFLGFVPDAELKHLYQTSTALIQPSLSEGFGLTGLEALAAGGRVVASNIPIFHEVYQHSALFFEPHSPDSFAETIHKLETTPAFQQPNLELLQRYSWDTMAEQTLTTYQDVLSDL